MIRGLLGRVLGWKNPVLVVVALLLINLPAIAGAVQQHRLASSGVRVEASVLQRRTAGGEYFLAFAVPAGSPRSGDPGFRASARVDREEYAAAGTGGSVGVRVLPGSTTVWRVDGQITSRAGWWVTLGADVLLLAVVLLYVRFRVLSRPTLVLLAESEPVPVDEEDLLDRLGGQRYLVRGTVIGTADDGVVLAVVDRRVKVLLDGRVGPGPGARVRVVGTMVG